MRCGTVLEEDVPMRDLKHLIYFEDLLQEANNDLVNTLCLFDRSYLKLRNVELYYNFPASMLEKVKFVSGVRVYVKGIDLFTFDNLDNGDAGAYGATLPLTRNVQVGASISF